MSLPAYTVVVATFQRPDDLHRALESLAAQTHSPALVVVVDSSPEPATREVTERWVGPLRLRYERAEQPSAAVQRNQGARLAETPLVAFVDDDAILPPDTAAKLCQVFADDATGEVGGVAGRTMEGGRPVPRGLLWWYYRLQAGYAHPTYGGKVFGAAINCYPSYVPAEAEGDLIPAQWLSSTCVWYRTELFRREEFPRFKGYSYMEDLHLSARIGKTHRLYFHGGAPFEHRDAPSTFKRDHRGLARSRWRNQRMVAREVLGLRGLELEAKLLLHRLFVTVYLLRRRGPGTWGELVGTWL